MWIIMARGIIGYCIFVYEHDTYLFAQGVHLLQHSNDAHHALILLDEAFEFRLL
jgi:hypothetical protein